LVDPRSGRMHRRIQPTLGVVVKQIRGDLRSFPGRDRSLLQNLADAFERDGQRLKVFRFANGAKSLKTAARVDQVVGSGAEDRVDLVVAEAFLLAENEARPIDQELKNLLRLLGRNLTLRRIRMQS